MFDQSVPARAARKRGAHPTPHTPLARLLAVLTGIVIVASWPGVSAAPQKPSTMPLDPPRERGTSISPAYEGWLPNADGSFSLLIGYYNRNSKETLDIPVGPNNRISPGEADQGQPTH